MVNTDKADTADKARVEIRKVFFILEVEKLIPEVSAEIPNIGTIENLYQHTFECMDFCLRCKDIENEYFIFSINQLAIIFDYLQSNQLIKSDVDLSGFLIKETTAAVSPEALPTMAIETPQIIVATTPPTNLWDVPNFDGLGLPESIVLNAGSTIINVKACIQSHMDIVIPNNGNKAYLPYYKRLVAIHEILIKQSA